MFSYSSRGCWPWLSMESTSGCGAPRRKEGCENRVIVWVGSTGPRPPTILQRSGDFPAAKLDNFTGILLELRARPSGESLLRNSPQWVTDHAPVTGSVLCGARPSHSDRNRTAGCADRRWWARMGHRHVSLGYGSMGHGCRVDVGCAGRRQKCLSHGAAVAEVVD